jgi:hypothetical protein
VTESKHTPGPWTIEYIPACDTEDKNAMTAITCHADKFGKEGAILATVNRWSYCDAWPRRESQANAFLIAAAPDLLDALSELVVIADRDNAGDPDRTATDNWRKKVWSIAREAITKAKGELKP